MMACASATEMSSGGGAGGGVTGCGGVGVCAKLAPHSAAASSSAAAGATARNNDRCILFILTSCGDLIALAPARRRADAASLAHLWENACPRERERRQVKV